MASENLAPETTEDVFSMVDVLREEEELEADANAVLGGSDDKNCTYPMGYKPRQALYACATCSPFEPAGICLACSLECHEGHDLYELYTKRNFRCDCGNSKFPDLKCKLYPVKDHFNSENRYNHNFTGSYCTCKRPYPDPDDEIEDEMIQCIVCEDWYHGRHLRSDSVPGAEDFTEMTCGDCVQKHDFLVYYNVDSKETQVVQKVESTENVEVKVEDTTREQTTEDTTREQTTDDTSREQTAEDTTREQTTVDTPKEQTTDDTPKEQTTVDISKEQTTDDTSKEQTTDDTSKEQTTVDTSKEPHSSSTEPAQDDSICNTDSENADKCVKSEINGTKTENSEDQKSETDDVSDKDGDKCLLNQLKRRDIQNKDGTVFWTDGWRNKLCRCSKCMDMYKDKQISFLIDESDTVHAYETMGQALSTPTSQYDKGLQALSNMNRVQQVEVLHGFMDLKSSLSDYLKKFAENGKVVREEDIREFFSQLEARKRQRTAGPPQYFCK